MGGSFEAKTISATTRYCICKTELCGKEIEELCVAKEEKLRQPSRRDLIVASRVFAEAQSCGARELHPWARGCWLLLEDEGRKGPRLSSSTPPPATGGSAAVSGTRCHRGKKEEEEEPHRQIRPPRCRGGAR
jgi:hypothetical protein